MSSVTQLNDQLDLVRNNPMLIQELQLATLEEALNGAFDVVDATSPFVHLMESAAVTTASLHRHLETIDRRRAPQRALTREDLYLHMSDDDYLGVFGQYSTAPFRMFISEAEIRQRAVVTADGVTRKLVIPRGTVIRPNDIPFTLQYPLEIRVLASGGIQVLYDTDVVSPLQQIESNIVNWYLNDISGVRHIEFEFTVPQLEVTTFIDTPNVSVGYKQLINFPDQFYYCRVYGANEDGSFTEYKTTHDAITYDPTEVTAVLKVLDNQLQVQIPLVYLTAGLVSNQLRIDIYTTRGDFTQDLRDYNVNAFPAEWGTEYTADQSVFSAPLSLIASKGIYSAGICQGGRNALTTEELRARVMAGISPRQTPITPLELEAKLTSLGYSVIKSVDRLTTRKYLASRGLPTIAGYKFNSGAACTIDTLQTSYSQLELLATVRRNGERLTVLSNTLLQYKDGTLQLVPTTEIPNPTVQGNDTVANILNNGTYVYTPFHYVLDATDNQFNVRAFYLDAPTLKSRRFLTENETTGLFVTTDGFLIQKTAEGYLVTVKTRSSEVYKALAPEQLHAQLYFVPPGESSGAYVNGTVRGVDPDSNEYYWDFRVVTNYDVSDTNALLLTNFTMFDTTPQVLAAPLNHEWRIVYGVSEYNVDGFQRTSIDDHLGMHLLPDDTLGLTEELLVLELGVYLERLWSNGRSVASTVTYERHPTDVYLTYKSPVYRTDPVTGAVVLERLPDDTFKRTVLHNVGDIVYEDGEPVVLFPAGSVVIDPVTELPVIANGRTVLRQVDLLLVDAIYLYATVESDIAYRDSIAQTLVGYINTEIAALNAQLYDRTELYYYPNKNIGFINVIADDQRRLQIPSSLSFVVRCYLSETKYLDDKVREVIRTAVKATIASALTRTTVSLDSLIVQLRTALGDDVISIDLEKLGPSKDISTFTVADSADRASVKRVLELLPNNRLNVIEDVLVDFKRHTA